MGHNTTQNERNMPELRLRNKKFAYKYQPTIRRNLKDRLPQQNQEQKEKTATQPRPVEEPKNSPQGRNPTEEEKTQPIMPPPEQSRKKKMKGRLNMKKYGNETRKKWERGRNTYKYLNQQGKKTRIPRK